MDILNSKGKIIEEINNIFLWYQSEIEEYNRKEKESLKEKELIQQANHRLIQEVSEKDKLLFINEKKFLDYEMMINKIQDEALEEMDVKTRHDMLRAQDKEIFDRDEEIKRLQKKVDRLENEREVVKDDVKEVVEDIEESKENILEITQPEKSDHSLVQKMMDIEEKHKEEKN